MHTNVATQTLVGLFSHLIQLELQHEFYLHVQLMNVLPLLIVLKIPIVLTLPMALSVSVHLGSWVMGE